MLLYSPTGNEAEKQIVAALNLTRWVSIDRLVLIKPTERPPLGPREFSERDADTSYTVSDLLRLMGFERLTVPDGLS
jgi:hypothetical protein